MSRKNAKMLNETFKKINTESSNIKICQETQKTARELANFGYNTNSAILEDLNDEINELKDELNADNKHRIEEELGDVVFVLCNLANQYGIDLDKSLNYSTKEFQRRLVYIENKINGSLKDLDNSEIVKLWKEAKNNK